MVQGKTSLDSFIWYPFEISLCLGFVGAYLSWFSPRRQQRMMQLLSDSSPLVGWGGESEKERQNSWAGIKTVSQNSKQRRK